MQFTKLEIYPGAFHLPDYLALEEQEYLTRKCRELGCQPAGFYTPVARTGAYMQVRMMCLGLHWNPKTYKYEKTRSDHDNLPVQELPEDLKQLAVRIAREVNMTIEPDICLVNDYTESGKLGLHKDKDERPETLMAGIPVVSISLGNTAEFVFGGTLRKDATKTLLLKSGDAFVFGGPSRLRYHGIASILPDTAPPELKMKGRFSLTFRQY